MNEVDAQEEGIHASQASYVPTPYEDSSWEIVGEPVETKEFVPMEVTILPRTQSFSDPMFADYGGVPSAEGTARWHLPKDEAARMQQALQQSQSQAPVEPQIVMTEEELETIKQAAFLEGQQAGLEGAVAANAERMGQAEARVAQVLQDLQQQVAQHGKELERASLELVLQIADKLLPEVVEINPEYIVQILNEALALSGSSSIKTIRVSAADLEFIKLVGVHKGLKEYDGSWKFEADETVRSGCIVETSSGTIDFQIDAAWDRIRDKILKVL